MNTIDLINVNVYLTNILLLPPILFIILIIKTIHKWKEKPNLVIQQFYFLCFWYFVLSFLIIGIFLSCIYHYYMFEDCPFIHKIGQLDIQYSAPLLVMIGCFLTILYYLYLKHPCAKVIPTIKHITTPIFYTSVCFSIIGISSYIIRQYWFPEWDESDYFKCRGLCSHIFFHYMTYTGVILLLLLYYIEIRPIFLAFFQTDNICTDIQKIE